MPSGAVGATTFVQALHEGCAGVTEYRIIRPDGAVTKAFSDPESIVQAHPDRNVYVGIATRQDQSSGTLENCQDLPALFIDIDFKVTPEARALERLEHFPLPPSIIVASGGGLHCYWLLREPVDLTVGAERDQARALLRRLALELGGDLAAAESARVLRVPGSRNVKPEYGTPRPVVVQHFAPDRRYNPSELDDVLLPEMPPAGAAPSAPLILPATIPEGAPGRNIVLFRYGRSLKATGVKPLRIIGALHQVNRERCLPPLAPDEMDALVNSVLGTANRPSFGQNGQPEPAPDDDGLTLTSIGALLEEPDEAHAWLIADRLPCGGLGLLAGKPKAGKSTLARCLALRVARGEPWLGCPTTAGPVIYLALEEKRAEVRAHFRALGATAADPIFILCSSAPADALRRLRREVERRHPVLIIIDPLFRLIRVQDGNDYATMTMALEPLLVLARETGAAVLLVHHLGKGQRTDEGDTILGSTAIFGAVDSALLMKRTERYRTLRSFQRYGTDLEEVTLGLDPHTRDVSAGPPRVVVEQQAAERLILEALAGSKEPLTEGELDALVECRDQPKRAGLRALVKAGTVSRTGKGGKADPFRYSCSLVPTI